MNAERPRSNGFLLAPRGPRRLSGAMTVLFWLVRHGETADNAARIFQGQGGRGLNAHGRAQAARLAERLRRSPPQAIVASDLERATETARIVGEACSIPVELDADLREVDLGTWTGK